MKMIVGLGNPGREYAQTRHNIGFMAVDALAARHALSLDMLQFRAKVVVWRPGDGQPNVVLARPHTFMNASGDAVRALMNWYKVTAPDLVVVVDDLDLPFGRLRLRPQGSAGGHNGLRSIIAQTGTSEFPRLRVGIDRPPEGWDTRDYVLSPFTATERNELPALCARVADALELCLRDGIQQAMNVINIAQTV